LMLFLLLRELLLILLMWALMQMEFLLKKELLVHMVFCFKEGYGRYYGLTEFHEIGTTNEKISSWVQWQFLD
jgi:hypothetical protein